MESYLLQQMLGIAHPCKQTYAKTDSQYNEEGVAIAHRLDGEVKPDLWESEEKEEEVAETDGKEIAEEESKEEKEENKEETEEIENK